MTEHRVEEDCSDSDDDYDVEQLVEEALKNAQASLEYEIEERPTDTTENDCVAAFMSSGCGCKRSNGECSTKFSNEYVSSVRCTCAELSRNELDMVILGQLLEQRRRRKSRQQIAHHIPAPRQTHLCQDVSLFARHWGKEV